MKLINPNPFTTRPEIVGTFGVVASTHWIATAVGMGILERGGNAFDAAVATAFTLQVVEPHLNGPGGDVPLIFHAVKKGKTEVMCGQGVMPAKATIAHFKGLGLDLIPGTGLLPAAVPGTFDAYMLMLRDYGTMKLSDVLAPAIGYFLNGHPMVERASATIATVKDNFRDNWPTSAAVYLPGNKVPKPAELFRNQAVGNTYLRIIKEAEAGGGGREADDRARAQGVEPGLRRRGDRPLLHPRRADGRLGPAQQGPAARRGHGEVAGHRRGAAHLRLRPLHGVQGGPVGAEPGHPAEARAAERLQPRRRRSDLARLHPHPRRGEQARLRRPRGLLRRSRSSSTCRCRRCCRTPTTPTGAS